MEWQFGHNCKSYLPTLGKCRILIDLRRSRPDLVKDKWLGLRDLLVYTGWTPEDLIAEVESGHVVVERMKNGRLRFRVSASWDWDDCPLGSTGGQCLHYEEHDGQKIECLKDLETLKVEHPNMDCVYSTDAIDLVETRFAYVHS